MLAELGGQMPGPPAAHAVAHHHATPGIDPEVLLGRSQGRKGRTTSPMTWPSRSERSWGASKAERLPGPGMESGQEICRHKTRSYPQSAGRGSPESRARHGLSECGEYRDGMPFRLCRQIIHARCRGTPVVHSTRCPCYRLLVLP